MSDGLRNPYAPGLLWRMTAWPRDLSAVETSWVRIILWWEIRRPLYNAIVGLWGIACVIAFIWLMDQSGTLAPGEDAVEPLGVLAGVLLAGLVANVCYTFGWIVELALRRRRPDLPLRYAAIVFLAGLVFPCAIISLPVFGGLLAWVAGP